MSESNNNTNANSNDNNKETNNASTGFGGWLRRNWKPVTGGLVATAAIAAGVYLAIRSGNAGAVVETVAEAASEAASSASEVI